MFFLSRKLTVTLFILSLVVTVLTFNANEDTIPEESIRLRIVANSNNAIDQAIKQEIRDAVISYLNKKLDQVKDYEEARLLLYQEVEALNQVVNQILAQHDLEITYYVDYGLSRFPTKVYRGKLYQAGQYETLYIVLGEGKGDNWWCVLFPPLCLVDLQIENGHIQERSDVEYRFFIIDQLKEFFRSK